MKCNNDRSLFPEVLTISERVYAFRKLVGL